MLSMKSFSVLYVASHVAYSKSLLLRARSTSDDLPLHFQWHPPQPPCNSVPLARQPLLPGRPSLSSSPGDITSLVNTAFVMLLFLMYMSSLDSVSNSLWSKTLKLNSSPSYRGHSQLLQSNKSNILPIFSKVFRPGQGGEGKGVIISINQNA